MFVLSVKSALHNAFQFLESIGTFQLLVTDVNFNFLIILYKSIFTKPLKSCISIDLEWDEKELE